LARLTFGSVEVIVTRGMFSLVMLSLSRRPVVDQVEVRRVGLKVSTTMSIGWSGAGADQRR
jgi:hypothetical protein